MEKNYPNLNLCNLDLIPPMTEITLTTGQQDAFAHLMAFAQSPGQGFFILKGYAGTGKTTLLQHFAKWLDTQKKEAVLLAPTGRAAAVLKAKTGFTVKTIHSEMYKFQKVDGEPEDDNEEPTADQYGQMRLMFAPRIPDQEDEPKIYIVDEASMLGDEESNEQSFAQFGTGHLLTDFLGMIGQNKVIFSGDPCQLPPVGETQSPALTENWFRLKGLLVQSFELTEILRQKQGSPVLQLATRLRQMANRHYNSKWVKLPAQPHQEVTIASYQEIKEQYIHHLMTNGLHNSIAITLSNLNCKDINYQVRTRLFDGFPRHVKVGDLLIVTQNNYLVPLANGDFVDVVNVGEFRRVANIPFIQVKVKSRLSEEIHETWLAVDPLFSGYANLPAEQQRNLMINFSMRLRKKGIKPKSEAYQLLMQKDPFLNSLRANFGYAVTCHKSQGGEWDDVFFFLNKGMYVMDPPELIRWWYTGVTRSRKNLHLVRHWWIPTT